MNSEKKQKLVSFLKNSLLALAITIMLVTLVATNKQKTAKRRVTETQKLEQRLAKFETALSRNRELLDETKEANRTLRDILSELRGIHNDCQRDATENFLREHRNQTAR